MDHLNFDRGVCQLQKTILAQEKKRKKISCTTSLRKKKIKLKEKKCTYAREKNLQAKKLAHPPPHSKIKWSVSYKVFFKYSFSFK